MPRTLLLLILILLCASPFVAQAHGSAIEDLARWSRETARDEFLSEWERDATLDWIGRLRSRLELRGSQSREDVIPATRDILSAESTPQRKPHSNLRAFAEAMLKVYQETRERTDDPLELMRAFADFGGILNPTSVDAFAVSRDYLNGTSSVSAAYFDPAAVGLFVESFEAETANGQNSGEDGLGLGELDQSLAGQLPPEARKLDPAEGEAGVGADEVVPAHDTAF